ncbi:hypothetical protein ACQ9BO_26170 [Flavobacterium sp. P21]|uniref:hypothetical protein n=1 Tax=Flavobacterium sp. P21 TaxID=3423948 RepID=UPI003D67D1B2
MEPIVGYLLLGANLGAKPDKFSQAYNFGPYLSDALPVEEMLQLAIESWGKGEYIVEKTENQPHEAGLLKLDISKAISELKWKPKLNAEEAVSMTMDWYYLFFLNPNEMDQNTTKQIIDFLS